MQPGNKRRRSETLVRHRKSRNMGSVFPDLYPSASSNILGLTIDTQTRNDTPEFKDERQSEYNHEQKTRNQELIALQKSKLSYPPNDRARVDYENYIQNVYGADSFLLGINKYRQINSLTKENWDRKVDRLSKTDKENFVADLVATSKPPLPREMTNMIASHIPNEPYEKIKYTQVTGHNSNFMLNKYNRQLDEAAGFLRK